MNICICNQTVRDLEDIENLDDWESLLRDSRTQDDNDEVTNSAGQVILTKGTVIASRENSDDRDQYNKSIIKSSSRIL